MFIAFEGPDKAGKTTSATNLAHDGVAIYNATKEMHAAMQEQMLLEPELPVTYDRIDWLTHMVYRLAMPTREWNDERVRTVFAMPDTHLVFKLHLEAGKVSDELYEVGDLNPVNAAYAQTAMWLAMLNGTQGFSLFRSISVVTVQHDQETGAYSQRLAELAAPVFPWLDGNERTVDSDESLLEMLRGIDQQVG
ncbi:thymidylate kinase [Microbacterium phage ChickenKing]|nr:thymidylate kinase [Microbacterium phage ChickenKing]QNL31000.1 thymidylate kinase [Microbacterium phage GaeCeo]